MYHLILVAVGGAIGASCRHLAGLFALRVLGAGFPWGTLIVNVIGSFLMGLLIEALAQRGGTTNEVRLFLATGILGGFTTFSAFSLDFVALWQRGELFFATAYVIGSVLISICALFLGFWIVRVVPT